GAPVVRANEYSGTAEELVVRSGGSDGVVSVAVAAGSGSAIAGVDFTAAPNPAVVTFGDGDTVSKTVRIPLLDDAVAEGVESFSVQLSDVTGGAALGAATATVNIVDQDQQPAGLVVFIAPSFSVVEGVPLVSVPVVRTGGSSGRVTINVAVNNGTALEGPDFRSPPGPIGLVFENGEVGPKEIVFAINDDLAVESAETFSLSLFNPVGGVELGANQTTTVTIQDNDQFAMTVDFSQAGNLQPFPVDPITGVRFSSNVVGITNFTGGGSGNFVDPLLTPTTPAQAATYTGAGTILGNVDAGFRDRLRFRYGAPFPLDPAVDPDGDGFHEVLIFDGPDGTGNVLAIAELPLTDDTLLPVGAFGLTATPFEVRFDGVARSVAIGSQGDRIVIDDLMFG
ncbi:MAG: Calx-beta domain-containing protein, partial [Cyanophyceae cyanobacterium]